ncbi:hypothetical protein LZ198_35240 [Myxococcus sp. K15C18031901]|uniref:hypothetical protein n=1 Tax=Myxococcus dinghuensis TaxID=2906761 RepID=UPI0020A77775|nr:hypothetical protein [Myxococcus dinghuensis]MCP3104138.1 hypothetical protein [Myxococcus dinghuensis]
MSRIEPSGASPLSPDPTAEPLPPASPSLPRAPSLATPREHDAVRPYDGPAPRASSGTAKGPVVPRDSGPAVSAGALAATGGRLRAASPEVPADTYADLQSRLTRGVADWAVTDGDVAAVHGALGKLEPEVYRAALERLERDGLLKTYVGEQGPEARKAFLSQAESKGLLLRLQGAPASGPLGYPGRPDFYREGPRLPASLRGAVAEHAVGAGRAYLAAHGEYLDRYTRAVEDAKSLPELRGLGPPREADLRDRVLGLEARDPQREARAREWRRAIGTPESTVRAWQAVSARQWALSGQRAGGTFALEGEAELSRDSFKLGGEASLDSRGRVDVKSKSAVSVKGGPLGLEVSRDTKGQTRSEVKVDLGVVSLGRASDGELKVSVGVGETFGGYVTLDTEAAKFGGGVYAQVKTERDKAEVKLGATMKGLSRERAEAAVDRAHVGIFDEPPELSRGVSWEALTRGQQERYTLNGWTREDWARALPRG